MAMEPWNESSDEESRSRFANETREVDDPLEPEGEVLPPTGGEESEESFPLESLITPKLCGMIFAFPGAIQAKRTGHEWWQLDAEEKSLVGEATAPLMVYLVRKYLGDGVGIFATSAVALSLVYGPRQMREMQESENKKDRKTNPPTSQQEEDFAPSSESGAAENQSNKDDFSVPFRE